MTYLIDGTFNGILTAVFNSFFTKNFPTSLTDGNVQFEIGGSVIDVQTDKSKAERVLIKLKKIMPKREINKLYTAFRSCDLAKYTVIFNYIVKTIKENSLIIDKFSDSDVFNFDRLLSRVLLEVHRFKGFIRFSKTNDGIYYAKYYPDNDINELILPHFKARFKGMPFILHDLNHGVVSACFNQKSKTVYKKINPLSVCDEFDVLFKTYYDTVSIKERKNERLMKNYMPKRYHKYMPEKNELL